MSLNKIQGTKPVGTLSTENNHLQFKSEELRCKKKIIPKIQTLVYSILLDCFIKARHINGTCYLIDVFQEAENINMLISTQLIMLAC